ncbi:nitroreductase family protein [Streptomyces sp. NPDC000594]|uniref:nitroreductase family protein n=1 Tax=Streptomyces sp. NPDC000594 TaxID=3154261 RepID=UPI003317AB8F
MGPKSGVDLTELLDPQLARFWHETRLRATPGPAPGPGPEASPPPQPVVLEPWLAVAEVLALGYGERSGAVITKGRTLMRARTTPSAGALYPFELAVALRGADRYELYEYDAEGCCLRHAGPVATEEITALLAPGPGNESGPGSAPGSGPGNAPGPAPDLDPGSGPVNGNDPGPAQGPDPSDGPDPADRVAPPLAVVAVIGRPWTSMRKYGRRGYLYTHLDGAHAATGVALAAEYAGLDPVTHLRFDRHEAARLLGVADRCREPQVLIALADPVPGAAPSRTAVPPGTGPRRCDGAAANPFAVPLWRHGDLPPDREPGDEETTAWHSVRSISAFRDRRSTPRAFGRSRSVGATAPGTTGIGTGTPAPPLELDRGPDRLPPAAYPELVLSRNSAKGFLPAPVGAAALGRVLAGLRHELVLDSADGPVAGLRVLARTVDGIDPGAYRYDPGGHTLLPLGGRTPTRAADEAVVAACMGQGVVRDAAALFVLHSPVESLLGTHGHQGLAELHFHAGAAAQRLCLAAAAHTVGITCLGGFDAGLVAELVLLADHEEVIYVLACGVPDANAVKWDRAPIAYSHGRGPASGV